MAMRSSEGADLSRLNSFRVSARARSLAILNDRSHLSEVATILRAGEPSLILGGGSNVLFTKDFEGTVLQVCLMGRRVLEARANTDSILVEAHAGESWHDLVTWTLKRGLFGLENLSLIPGSVGAAPVQNIGAYGVELAEVLESVEALNIEDGQLYRLSREACELGYRDSIFRRAGGQVRWLIVSVRLALSTSAKPRLVYSDLEREFSHRHPPPSPTEVAEAVCRIRQRKLPDPKQLGNAGSFFRNPTLDQQSAEQLKARHPEMPIWPNAMNTSGFKLPAAWLIERCGWKGARRGDAGVHSEHALVLVNYGKATGSEIAALAADIQASVFEQFGVRLEPEVVFV